MISIRALGESDREWVRRILRERWGSERMVGHGDIFYPADHPGFLASVDDRPTGVLTYEIIDTSCEILVIDSGESRRGIGTALIQAVRDLTKRAGCTRLWLMTTNDNLDALRFYQRRGFVLAALRPNAVEEARRRKPEIPLVGAYGIPLRDEIDLEIRL